MNSIDNKRKQKLVGGFPQQSIPTAVDKRVYAHISKANKKQTGSLYGMIKKTSYWSVATFGLLIIAVWFFWLSPQNNIENNIIENTAFLSWTDNSTGSAESQLVNQNPSSTEALTYTNPSTSHSFDTSAIDEAIDEIDTILVFLGTDSEREFDTL